MKGDINPAMTNEEKQLLFKDLCARLPYGVKINIYDDYSGTMKDEELNIFHLDSTYNIEYRKLQPYLRPMSSMTEEEKTELSNFASVGMISSQNNNPVFQLAIKALYGDFFNKRHIDYRGLIPMGLALEAPDGMYKTY